MRDDFDDPLPGFGATSAPSKRRQAGSARGLIHVRDDFDDPLPEFDDYT
jgi:hypothetical protein